MITALCYGRGAFFLMINKADVESKQILTIKPKFVLTKVLETPIDPASQAMGTELHNLRVAFRHAATNCGWVVEDDDD